MATHEELLKQLRDAHDAHDAAHLHALTTNGYPKRRIPNLNRSGRSTP